MIKLEGEIKHLNKQEQEKIMLARAFANDYVKPNAQSWQDAGKVPQQVFELASQQGLCLLFNQADTKLNIGHLAMARVAEELGTGCLSVGLPLIVQNYISWAIDNYKVPDKRAELLNLMRHGKALGGICLTEPAGGSDAAAMKTRAVQQNDGSWLLNGHKAWVLSSNLASFFIVFSYLEQNGQTLGMGVFLVRRDSPGVIVGKPYDLLSGNALGCADLLLENVALDKDDLLIGPDEGFKFGMQIINFARIYVAALACGLLRFGLRETMNYTNSREAFGKPVSSFQGVQWYLSDILTNLFAARSLVDQALSYSKQQDTFKVAVAHAKKYATGIAYEGLGTCMQLHGANGLLKSNHIARQFWSAAISYYLDGTTEIQNVLISRSLPTL